MKQLTKRLEGNMKYQITRREAEQLALLKGERYLSEHRSHVASIIEDAPCAVAPTDEDLLHPELWKGIHWRWMYDTCYNRERI